MRSCRARTASSCSSTGSTRGVLEAVGYARSARPRPAVRLVRSCTDPTSSEAELHQAVGRASTCRSSCTTISSPYRELTRPILEFLDDLDAEDPDDIITVIIPEFVTSLSTQWLHNQSGLALKARLLVPPEHGRHERAGARRLSAADPDRLLSDHPARDRCACTLTAWPAPSST